VGKPLRFDLDQVQLDSLARIELDPPRITNPLPTPVRPISFLERRTRARRTAMSAAHRPVIALDIKLKHYRNPETDEVIGVDQYETGFAYRDRYHDVEIRCGRILAGLFGKTRISVNTNHHQAAHPDHVGAGLQPVALTDDGVIEALEADDDRWVLGVQWHPERIRDGQHREKVFGALLDAAREYRNKKR